MHLLKATEEQEQVGLTLGRLIAALWPTNRPIGWISKSLVMIILLSREHSGLFFKKMAGRKIEYGLAQRGLFSTIFKRALSRSLAHQQTSIHPSHNPAYNHKPNIPSDGSLLFTQT